MKKSLIVIVFLSVLISITACSNTTDKNTQNIDNNEFNNNSETVYPDEKLNDDNSELEMHANPTIEEIEELLSEENKEERLINADSEVDFDLTVMSPTMVFAQIFDLMYNADNYLEKTFKINGNHQIFPHIETGEDISVIIIYDALGCCPQGIELRFPESIEVPENLSDIIIKGELKVEFIGEYRYLYLAVSTLEIL